MWQLTDEDGLPSMEVYNVFQDQKGYIWMGTDNGVCRYDGKEFKLYYHQKQRGKSFSYFQQDKLGRIWCINFSGQLFYIEHDSLKLFEPYELQHQNSYPRYHIGPTNDLWIVSDINGVFTYPDSSRQLHKIPPSYFNKDFFTNVACTKNGGVLIHGINDYLMSRGKVVKQKPSLAMFIQYSKHTDEILGVNNSTESLRLHTIQLTNGDIVYKELDSRNLRQGKARVIDIISFAQNDNWLLTFDGAYLFERKNNQCVEVKHILKGIAVSWVAKDKEGNYWISTIKNGVYIMPSKDVWIMNATDGSLPNSRITRIKKSINGYLYLASASGKVLEFNPETKKINTSFIIDESKKDIEFISINPYENKLYAQNFDLLSFDLSNQRKEHIGAIFSSIKEISFDRWGNKLYSNPFYGMIECVESDNNPFYQYYKPNLTLNGRHVYILHKERSNSNLINESDTSIWISATDGVFCFKDGIKSAISWKNTPIYATKIIAGNDGNIWISTLQQGIIVCKGNKAIKQYQLSDGLKSNFIRCITSGPEWIWFASDKGVQAINPKTDELNDFAKEDGLITNDVHDICIYKNEVYLATSKGLEWFDARKIKPNRVPPAVFITSISCNDSISSIGVKHYFKYYQNNINIFFESPTLRSRGNFSYKYRLVGLDTSWTLIPGSYKSLSFNALEAGNYIFEIKAINEDGIESLVSASIQFDIAVPFWKTWWFASLVISSFLGLVVLLYRYQVDSIQKRNLLEREKSNLQIALRSSQLSALKSQMNPHFIFNALNSIQDYILTNEKRLANSYLGKFSDLMRLYLDMSNKSMVDFSEELKALRLYLELEAMRFEDSFTYRIDVDTLVSVEEIQVPPMLIQPYVENAIKHGLLHKKQNRALTIHFSVSNSSLICTITDNGIGRDKSAQINALRKKSHRSFATGANQKRIDLLNEERNWKIDIELIDLKDSRGLSSGTRVIIQIPFDIYTYNA